MRNGKGKISKKFNPHHGIIYILLAWQIILCIGGLDEIWKNSNPFSSRTFAFYPF